MGAAEGGGGLRGGHGVGRTADARGGGGASRGGQLLPYHARGGGDCRDGAVRRGTAVRHFHPFRHFHPVRHFHPHADPVRYFHPVRHFHPRAALAHAHAALVAGDGEQRRARRRVPGP